jgi:transcriptional pleiotropic regulator of transition state genes
MKSTGIVRRVDELGRIVIPMDLRRTFGSEIQDPLEIFVDGDTIVLAKYQSVCVFCGSGTQIVTFKGKNVCQDCMKDLNVDKKV